MSFNDNHPELKEGEVFIGNQSANAFDCSTFKTKRRGKMCYSYNGRLISGPKGDSRPMFASRIEHDEWMAKCEALKYSKNT